MRMKLMPSQECQERMTKNEDISGDDDITEVHDINQDITGTRKF